MEYYKNLSIENLAEEIDGILCVEEWKDIHGFEGVYQCSNFGRFKSLERVVTGKRSYRQPLLIQKQFKNKNGYLVVNLCRHGRTIHFRAHRLVCASFIANNENKKCVNHKNLNRSDNRVTNLEWVTHSENNLHSFRNSSRKGGMFGKFGKDNIKSSVVVQFDMSMNEINRFYGTNEAERLTGIPRRAIGRVCLGERPHSHGFIWRYEEYPNSRILNRLKDKICQ